MGRKLNEAGRRWRCWIEMNVSEFQPRKKKNLWWWPGARCKSSASFCFPPFRIFFFTLLFSPIWALKKDRRNKAITLTQVGNVLFLGGHYLCSPSSFVCVISALHLLAVSNLNERVMQGRDRTTWPCVSFRQLALFSVDLFFYFSRFVIMAYHDRSRPKGNMASVETRHSSYTKGMKGVNKDLQNKRRASWEWLKRLDRAKTHHYLLFFLHRCLLLEFRPPTFINYLSLKPYQNLSY